MDIRSARLESKKMHFQKGFTLIELIIVILILGILSATALPRFIDQRDNAIIAKHQAVVNAFKSGLTFSHQAWILDGAVPNALNVKVFEDAPYQGELAYSATGWPTGVGADNRVQFHYLCAYIFNILLKGVNSSQLASDNVTYTGRRAAGDGCRYELKEDIRLSFSYNAIDGQMVIDDVLE